MNRMLKIVRCLLLGACLWQLAWAGEHKPSADWSADMERFAQADAEQRSPEGCVLFLGSSSIRLWTSLEQDFPGVSVVNRGFGGSQIVDALVFFDRIVLPHQPRMIVLYAGTNDIAAGKTPVEVAADFVEFCERVHAERPQTKIVFIALQYAPARRHLRERMAETNDLIAKFCAADSRRAFVDMNPHVADAAGEPLPEIYSADRLHMAPPGYAVWTRELAPRVSAR